MSFASRPPRPGPATTGADGRFELIHVSDVRYEVIVDGDVRAPASAGDSKVRLVVPAG